MFFPGRGQCFEFPSVICQRWLGDRTVASKNLSPKGSVQKVEGNVIVLIQVHLECDC